MMTPCLKRCHLFCINRADIVDYGHAFNLTRYLANETEYIVWDRVSTSISYVRDMLADDKELYCRFQVGSQSIQYTLIHENNQFYEKSCTMFKCDLIPSVRFIADILYINVSKKFLFYIFCYSNGLFHIISV